MKDSGGMATTQNWYLFLESRNANKDDLNPYDDSLGKQVATLHKKSNPMLIHVVFAKR